MGDGGPGSGGFSREELRRLIDSRLGPARRPREFRVHGDTTNFLAVDYGDVALLGGKPYLIRNNEREGRFGLDDEPKFWVKRSIDLLSGETKVIKLGFEEEYTTTVGEFEFRCIRSPRKEARILDLVAGDDRFMQGFSVVDEAGNTVRIIGFIEGKTLADRVLTLGADHEEYYYSHFPGICRIYVDLVEAVGFLHSRGEKHGDIRRDHILVERGSGRCRWIDFDFNFYHASNPYRYDLFGLGNILVYLTGRGDVTPHELQRSGDRRLDTLTDTDMNVVFRNRVANLRKIYPYISSSLNRILLHFAAGAEHYYESVSEMLEDLYRVRDDLGDGEPAESCLGGGERGGHGQDRG